MLHLLLIPISVAAMAPPARLELADTTKSHQDTKLAFTPRSPAEKEVLVEIQRQYDKMSRGFTARDTAAIMRLRHELSAEYGDGRRDDAVGMARLLSNFFVMNAPPIQVRYTIVSLDSLSADRATVTTLQQGSRYQTLAGRRRRVEHDVTQRETWVRTTEGWRLHFVDQIRDRHRWVDGTPVDPDKPFDPTAPPFTPTPAR
jgi:hypothetical protein